MKTILITGATSGIGYHAALQLARLGHHIVIVSRNRSRGIHIQDELKRKSANDRIDLMLADLSSLESVRLLAFNFKNTYGRLDVLINNAGTLKTTRQLTEDGFEVTFQVNHLSHFLLTNLLMDVLAASAPSRIINVASEAHRRGKMHFDDLQLEFYGASKAYSQSKLANVLFTYELADRLKGTGITVNCMHPGVIYTGLWRDRNGFLGTLMGILSPLVRPFLQSPASGAKTITYLAVSPDVAGVTGRYFVDKRPVLSSRASRDVNSGKRLWSISEQLIEVHRAGFSSPS